VQFDQLKGLLPSADPVLGVHRGGA
jgi:hypothetical protein